MNTTLSLLKKLFMTLFDPNVIIDDDDDDDSNNNNNSH